ncbi:MAG: hypothetical protein M1813_002373 [Trichoglossum hirsutum]|nr:MAG: hypothetical protein M1813_002373 [Trichoglossum hirsutum]
MGAKLNCKNPHAIVLAMGFTGLDAIQFFQDEVKQTRDYCQTPDDQAIRESSFNSDNGWFVWGMVVVTTNAKNKSPITVTSWIADGAMQIRVYFLDSQNNICECKGQHESGAAKWEPSTVLRGISSTEEPKVADGSQLTVSRSDSDDRTLRLFIRRGLAPTAKVLCASLGFPGAVAGKDGMCK